jgi:methionyl aminopeptidase
MTTKQLDQIGEEFLKQHGARSAPILAYNYPGYTCISVNDVAAHGIPSEDLVLQPGDMLNVDVSAELEGYWADTGASMPMPPVNPTYQRLCEYTLKARDAGIAMAHAGKPINLIGRAVEQIAAAGGYRVIKQLNGHGVGRHIHEKPSIPNYYNPGYKEVLTEGVVITIEPFLSLGVGRVFTDKDGWTLRSMDGSIAAQYEHTLVIMGNEPVLVTAI